MAKDQNTFIKSKMNKDLDDRLLSKGEYRNAQNINVSKSEGADVGAMENVLGNLKLQSFTSGIDGAVIIGEYMDFTNERIFVMITNYTDVNGNTNNTNYAPAGAYCAIGVYDLNISQSQILVKGSFLNLSTTNLVNGINIIEDLLFWTDDRNQPRKINVDLAISADANSANPHYTNEDQISLAKYYPYKVPQLFDSFELKSISSPGYGDITITGGTCNNDGGSQVGDTTITFKTPTNNIFESMSITGGNIPSNTIVTKVKGNVITLSKAFTQTDPDNQAYALTWRLLSSDSIVKAGMYIVLDPTEETQAQNIRISNIVSDTQVNLSSTVSYSFTTAQTIKVYYPTSYTKKEKYCAPSAVGVVSSFESPATIPYHQGTGSQTSFSGYFNQSPKVGQLVSCAVGGSTSVGIKGGMREDTLITNVSGNSNPYTITLSKSYIGENLTCGSKVLLSDKNPYYDQNWPGDPDFIKDKFVRFSYRFKFEDGEYSLMAPFTQPCFIPEQDGYLSTGLNKTRIMRKVDATNSDYTQGSKAYEIYNFSELTSQQENIAKSTVVQFFENRIQEVDIKINCDYIIKELYDKLKVVEIDILYKESNGLQVKVLDTFSNTDIEVSSNDTNIFTYNYQSRKPFRNLTDAEVVRVYDKIPVKAKTQSVTGNRLVFGNFTDKPTPPLTLDYAVGVSEKFRLDAVNGINNGFSNLSASAAYPNHSVKQNRTYQVGIILQDKYGRSSDVILSSLGDKTIQFPSGAGGALFSGSTIFHNYRLSTQSIYNWFGDSIKILFQNPIPESVSYANGYPGIYRSGIINATCSQQSADTFFLTAWDDSIAIGSVVRGLDSSSNSFSESIIAFDKITTPKTITLSSNVTINASTPVEIIGNANPLGWYSYKIVVKQEAEDYYNAYLPNALAGSTQWSINESSNQGYITLAGDNINKIPADLTEVAPEQTQFRTSDEVLYPRVAAQQWNTETQQVNVSAGENPTRSTFFTIDAMGKVTDMGIATSTSPKIKAAGIYNAQSNPVVAKIRTYGTQYGGFYNNPSTFLGNKPTDSRPALSGSGSFASAYPLNGSRFDVGDAVQRGSSVPGFLFPKPKTSWAETPDDPTTLKIGSTVSTGWGYWSDNGNSSIFDSQATSTDGDGTGMRVRGMSIGPNNETGVYTSPFEYANPASMYWFIVCLGSGYEVGDEIVVDARPNSSGSGTYWSHKLKFQLKESHLNQPSGLASPGLPISIMEVKPKNSNLDIYWETSTSGLISDLNKTINDAAALSQPTTLDFTQIGTSRTDVYFPETLAANTNIATFQTRNGINGLLGNVTYNLDQVRNGSGTIISSQFALTQTSGTGNIIPTSPKFFENDNNNNQFTFFITATNVDLGISYSNTFNFSGSIINSAPFFCDIDGNVAVQADFNGNTSGGFLTLSLYARNGAYHTVADEQIRWTLGSEPSGGTWSLLDGTGGVGISAGAPSSSEVGLKINKNRIRFAPPESNGTYTNTIFVRDGSGVGLTSNTFTMQIVVASPEGGSSGG